MSKISLKQLMELHNLEDGDEFKIDNQNDSRKIIDNYPCIKSISHGYVTCVEDDIKYLLSTSEVTITKKYWYPESSELCLLVQIDSVIEWAWYKTDDDEFNMECGLVFKKSEKEKAESRRQELVKWLKESAK